MKPIDAGPGSNQRPVWPILLACAAMSDCKDEEVKGEKEEVEDERPDWRNDDEWPQYDEESMEEVEVEAPAAAAGSKRPRPSGPIGANSKKVDTWKQTIQFLINIFHFLFSDRMFLQR